MSSSRQTRLSEKETLSNLNSRLAVFINVSASCELYFFDILHELPLDDDAFICVRTAAH